jgi:lysophospholipase L1-like esterase
MHKMTGILKMMTRCKHFFPLIALLAAVFFGSVVTPSAAFAQTVSRLELQPTDRVLWRSRDNESFLIINIFSHDAKLKAAAELERNELLINTALVEGALLLERPENQSLTAINLLIVSMRDMSEYGGSGSNWTQIGTGVLTKGDAKVELKDVKLAGALPAAVPSVVFPYKEASAITAASIRFKMPKKLFAVVGEPQNFFYENLVVSKDIEDFQYVPTGNSVGFASQGRRGLTFNAQAIHVGEHPLFIKVTDWKGKVIAEGATTVVVVPAAMSWQPAQNEPVRVLILGHSLPSMYYPAYIADDLAGPGNPPISFVGGIKYWYGKLPDFKNNPNIDAMFHQASPGYSAATVLNLYTEEPPANPNMPAKSPFMFKDAGSQPALDFNRYFTETLKGAPPHIIMLNIGDNDTFNFNPDVRDGPDEKLFVSNMNRLLTELRQIAPDATIGAIMPNTYNHSDRSFLVNYGPTFPRWRLLQNRQRYIELMSEIADARGDVLIVPSNFSVDSVDGMPYNSGTHFNAIGARQFATSVYAWMKGQFAAKGGTAVAVAAQAVATVPVVTAPVPAVTAPAAVPTPAPSPAVVPATPVVQPTVAPVSKPGWWERTRERIMRALSFN